MIVLTARATIEGEENVQPFFTPRASEFKCIRGSKKQVWTVHTDFHAAQKTRGSLKHCLTREIYTRSCKSCGCIYNTVLASLHLVVGAQKRKKEQNKTRYACLFASIHGFFYLENGLEQQYLHSLCTHARFYRTATLRK